MTQKNDQPVFDLLAVIGAPAEKPMKIADREFEVRAFTATEGMLIDKANGAAAQAKVLAEALNKRLLAGEEITGQWILDTLSTPQMQAVYNIFTLGRFPDEVGAEGK